jgi:hypothetical protein
MKLFEIILNEKVSLVKRKMTEYLFLVSILIYSVLYLLEALLEYFTTLHNGIIFSVLIAVSLAIVSALSIYKKNLFNNEPQQEATEKNLVFQFLAGVVDGLIYDKKTKQT